MRTAYGDDQEAIRQSNVRAMAMALMKNVLQAPPVEIPGLIQNLSQCVSTSIDLQTMISLATDFAQAGNPTIYTCTGPYKGDFMEEYGCLLYTSARRGGRAVGHVPRGDGLPARSR